MAGTLTVWKFHTPDGAEEAAEKLADLQKQEVISVRDAAIVSWPPDRKRPKTRQLHNLAGIGALSGSFWGLLFGLLFFVPLLGMAIGAAAGALTGKFSDIGIDDKFIEEIRAKVTPGTSALFALTSDAVIDRVKGAFEGTGVELMYTNLSAAEEEKLKEIFGADNS